MNIVNVFLMNIRVQDLLNGELAVHILGASGQARKQRTILKVWIFTDLLKT